MNKIDPIKFHECRTMLEQVDGYVEKYIKLCRAGIRIEQTIEDAQDSHRQTLRVLRDIMANFKVILAMSVDGLEVLHENQR